MPNWRPEVGIAAPDSLASLEAEWSALWRRCPGATPFLAPEWLLPWARHHAPGRCGAAVLRDGGRLVGIVPVFCWRGALLLAGTGPSDRAGALVEPGFESEGSRLLAALPEAAPEPFERIDLRQLPPDSPLLSAEAPPGWRGEEESGEDCLVAHMAGEDGLGALSRRRRENWRYAVRRLKREGAEIGSAAGEEVAPAMADLLRLHALRWQARGEAGVLEEPLLRAMLIDAAPGLERAGLLRLHEIRLGRERAAVLLVLAGGGTHHYYIGSFDPAWARLSPAAALIGAAMRLARREGAMRFDFLRGAEPYKADWGARPEPLRRRLLSPTADSLRGVPAPGN